MKYTLIDQTGEQFGRDRAWLTCRQDKTPERTRTTGFCIVPQWEDRSRSDSKNDAEKVLAALRAIDEADALRAQNAALVAAANFALKYSAMQRDKGNQGFPSQLESALKAAIAAAKSEATNAG